jgi:hypothetical protein
MTGSVEAPSALMTGAVIASDEGNGALASPPGGGPSGPELEPLVPDDEPDDPPEDVVEPEPEEEDDDVELFDGPPPYGCPVESGVLPQAAITTTRPRAAAVQYRSCWA